MKTCNWAIMQIASHIKLHFLIIRHENKWRFVEKCWCNVCVWAYLFGCMSVRVNACCELVDISQVSYLCRCLEIGDTENIPVWSLLNSANELIFFFFDSFFPSLLFFLVTDLQSLVRNVSLQVIKKPTVTWRVRQGDDVASLSSEWEWHEGGRKKRDLHNLSHANPHKLCPLPPILRYFACIPTCTHTQKHTLLHVSFATCCEDLFSNLLFALWERATYSFCFICCLTVLIACRFSHTWRGMRQKMSSRVEQSTESYLQFCLRGEEEDEKCCYCLKKMTNCRGTPKSLRRSCLRKNLLPLHYLPINNKKKSNYLHFLYVTLVTLV